MDDKITETASQKWYETLWSRLLVKWYLNCPCGRPCSGFRCYVTMRYINTIHKGCTPRDGFIYFDQLYCFLRSGFLYLSYCYNISVTHDEWHESSRFVQRNPQFVIVINKLLQDRQYHSSRFFRRVSLNTAFSYLVALHLHQSSF